MITEEDRIKLGRAKSAFKKQLFSREELNFILDKELTDKDYQIYVDSEKRKHVFKQPKEKLKQPKEKAKKPIFSSAEIAKHAAKKAQRKTAKKQDDIYRIATLFKSTKNNYTISKVFEYYNQKFKTNLSHWKIHGEVDIFQIQNAIEKLVSRITENFPENVKLQISLENTKNNRVNETKLLNKNDIIFKVADWVSLFIDYYDMDIHDLTFKLMAIEIPTGGRANNLITPESKRSLIQVTNNDTICLARAIVVGLAINNKEKLQIIFKNALTPDELKQINKTCQNKSQIDKGTISANEILYIKKGRKLQKVLATALHRICRIKIKENGNDFQDAKAFEERLDIEIQIYDATSRKIYSGRENPTKVHILMSDNHYDVISNLAGFTCENASNNKARDAKCKACGNKTKCNVEEPQISCTQCSKYFYGDTCFTNHKTNKKCIEHSYRCKTCHRIYITKDLPINKHKCNELKCGNCKQYADINHKCYMLKKELKPKSEEYIFFDFETKLDQATNKHVVNYCVVQYFTGEEKIFTSIDQFCTWIFDKKHKNYTVIAHYGKGYDFQFIAEWLIAHSVKPYIIHNGQKIMQLEIKKDYNIRFIDSISFTLIPLKDFPKTFGLKELAKGYFPHKFNTDDNQNYVGPYPDRAYYGYDEMKQKDKEIFDEWYETTAGKTFDFKQEIYKYCKSDVDILRRGCIKLRELFLAIANIDLFQYITIASVCQAIYRSEFLPENTIGVCSETPIDNYSVKSIKWLKYISQTENVDIRHACNGGEVVIQINGKTYKVDGYCENTKTIYQFHGCYFHGCSSCYDELTVNRLSQYNMKYLYKRTSAIDEQLRSNGYNLVTIWEHEFDKNKSMRNIKLDEYELVEPPKIRGDAFTGGRCEPIKLIYDFKNKSSKGKYIDVVSLYPSVMYYDKYPVGHPVKISKPKQYDENWFGFIYCKVLPPRGLYLPVLPFKQKTEQAQKLLFGLCRTCMARIDAKCSHFNTNKGNVKCSKDCTKKACLQCKGTRKAVKQNCERCYNERNADCTHSDAERAITGFWTTTELHKALEKGYKIDKIYEVWHFEHSSTDLWKGYIRKFLKIKLETSKFTCSEEEYREKARKFGIELGELKENPGLRFIAKICLNSLWGKFGQNPKVKHNEYIDTVSDFYKVILNDKIEQISLSFLNDNMVYASYETKDEFLKINYNTNIYIACFTSSWARLRLYDMMEKLDRNVCYCDTDSIVYIENEETKEILDQYIGDGLGQWADELQGNHIDFWSCAQAKDYGYILDNGKYVGKIKGFKVNADAENKLTFEQRKQLIMGTVNNIGVNYDQFTIKHCEITTKHMVKQWSFKFNKRMIRKVEKEDQIDTLPYGY